MSRLSAELNKAVALADDRRLLDSGLAVGSAGRPERHRPAGPGLQVEGVFVVTNLGLNVALVLEFGWTGAAVATALSALLATVLAHRALAGEVDFELPLAEIGRQVLASLVMGVVVVAGTTVLPGKLPVGLGLVFVGAAVYSVVVFVLSPTLWQVVGRNLSGIADRR